MISLHTRYKISIKDRYFINDAGVKFPQTATVTIYDNDEKSIYSNDYGFLPTEEIYNLLDGEDTVNLDNCYVKNFSLTAYRRTRIIHKKEIINLKGFSARNAFFKSNYHIDFSYADFGNTEVDFSGTYFASGIVNFHASKFGKCNVNFNSCAFRNGHFDFSNIIHQCGNFNFKNITSTKGYKTFQDARFGDGVKAFSNSNFGGGDINFINVNFGNGKVSFKVSNFGSGLVDFHFSTFLEGFVDFDRVSFGDGFVNFKNVEFGKGKVNFNRSIFGCGDITFEGCVLDEGKFTIKWVSFGSGNINFEQADMENISLNFDKASFDRGNISRVSFNRSKFKLLSLRSCHLDDYFDLRVYKCEKLDLSNTIVRDIIDLKTYDYSVDIKTLDMAHMRLIGIIDIDWKANGVWELISSQENTDNWTKAEQFRTLKENFNKCGRYADEDKAYVEFKRFEQKAILEENTANNKLKLIYEYPYYCLKVLIFDKMGLYATGPIRVMVSMIVAFALFAFTYVVFQLTGHGTLLSVTEDCNEVMCMLANAFYFSAITFLTVGYGDYIPIGIFRTISAIEGFIGVFLLAYFTVAFVRKILR